MNNTYAKAYVQQINPIVARSYYFEHNTNNNGQYRSNYSLTSEHQKVICVLIMIALGCYVIGFAIIMIRQVIKDAEQRDDDACSCVKYNGENCDSSCLDEITDDIVMRDQSIPVLCALKKQRQKQPIDISVNMDGTYCRESIEPKLCRRHCDEDDKENQNNYLIESKDKSNDQITHYISPIPLIHSKEQHLYEQSNTYQSYESNKLPTSYSLEFSMLNRLNNQRTSTSDSIVNNNHISLNNLDQFVNNFNEQLRVNNLKPSISINTMVNESSNNDSRSSTIVPQHLNYSDKLNFKQTEIYTNSEEERIETKLFSKMKSLVLVDYLKQKKLKLIEHL